MVNGPSIAAGLALALLGPMAIDVADAAESLIDDMRTS
jgi:hypothetical protein